MLHVFLDTNIYLGLFRYSDEDLKTLQRLLEAMETKVIRVYTTDQVRDEFYRNREKVIADNLRVIGGDDKKSLPRLGEGLQAYDEALDSLKQSARLRSNLVDQVRNSAIKRELHADALISGIFEKAHHWSRSVDVENAANRRKMIGNPPGKSNTIGDEINWELMLLHGPKCMYVVARDSDYESPIDQSRINAFLEDEYKKHKGSDAEIILYRSLRAFLKDHLAHIDLAPDPDREAAIEALIASTSFFRTHQAIAELDKYTTFFPVEAERMIDAAASNSQILWIISDSDVKAFYSRLFREQPELCGSPSSRIVRQQIQRDDPDWDDPCEGAPV